MNKGRELTIEEIKNLKNFSKVWFDLEYCNALHINTYYSEYSEFEDYDGNTFKIAELISYMEKGQIKVYETEDTKISEIKPMTNYEKIKSMTIEEMAKSVVNKKCDNCTMYISCHNNYKCIQEEINWLKQEVE